MSQFGEGLLGGLANSFGEALNPMNAMNPVQWNLPQHPNYIHARNGIARNSVVTAPTGIPAQAEEAREVFRRIGFNL